MTSTQNSTLTASNFAGLDAAQILERLAPRGVAVEGVQVEQNWDDEQTVLVFADKSRIVVSGPDVEVYGGEAWAAAKGAEDGVEDVETVLAEQGRDAVIATLKPGHVGWDEGAINAGAHRLSGVSDELRDAYYEAYAKAARARAEEIYASTQISTTVADAIRTSQRENRIVHLDHTEELETDLLCESDDSAENGEVVEFWGENEHGEWRVHLTREGSVSEEDADRVSADPEGWAVFTAEDGSELTRGWQGYEHQARKMAQQAANRIGQAVELVRESDLSAYDPESDDAAPEGEVIEPESGSDDADAAIKEVLDGVDVYSADGCYVGSYGETLLTVVADLDGTDTCGSRVDYVRCSRERAKRIFGEHPERVAELREKACGGSIEL